MNELWVALAALALIAFLALLVSRATRLDRLHNDVLRSRATLDRLLRARAELSLELARSGELDLAASMILGEAALRTLDDAQELVPDGLDPTYAPDPALAAVETRQRALVESELSKVLRETLPDVADSELAARIVRGWRQMRIARQLHNQKVAMTRRLRRAVLVRLFHLAGHAPLPVTFDMDDELPLGFEA